MNNLNDIIKKYIFNLKVRQIDIAKKLGVTQQSLSKSLNNDNMEFSTFKNIANALDCDINIELVPNRISVVPQKSNLIKIPYYEDAPASAGTGCFISSEYALTIELPQRIVPTNADFAIRVSGDSMQPRYCDGDVVLVHSTPTIEIGEVGIFVLNDEAYIKELGENELISLNKKYSNIPFNYNDSIECKGKVLKVLSMQEKV